jgi:hypothetical protein
MHVLIIFPHLRKCDELERTLVDLRAKTSALLPVCLPCSMKGFNSVLSRLTEDIVKPPIPDSASIQEGLIEADPTFKTDRASEAEPKSTSQASMPILTTEDLIAWSQEGFT